MTSPPLGSTNGRTASGVACHCRPWTANTVEQSLSSHAIIDLERQPRLNNVGRGMQSSPLDKLTQSDGVKCCMPSLPLDSKHGRTTSGVACNHSFGQHRQSNGVGRGIPSSPLGSTDGRTAWGVACHHRLWPAHTVERRRAWHAIIAFGQHTRSNDVGRGMPSSPSGSTHSRTTSGVAIHHSPWTEITVGRRQA